MFNYSIFLENKKFLFKFGNVLSKIICSKIVFFLVGDLGVGKTSLTKGMVGKKLNYFLYVNSPTYSIVEIYSFKKIVLYHFDFFKLLNLSELNDIGFKEYINFDACLVIEWGDRFFSEFKFPYICIYFHYYSILYDRIFYLKSNFLDFSKLFG